MLQKERLRKSNLNLERRMALNLFWTLPPARVDFSISDWPQLKHCFLFNKIYCPWKGFPLLVEQNRQSLLSFWEFSLDTLDPGHKKMLCNFRIQFSSWLGWKSPSVNHSSCLSAGRAWNPPQLTRLLPQRLFLLPHTVAVTCKGDQDWLLAKELSDGLCFGRNSCSHRKLLNKKNTRIGSTQAPTGKSDCWWKKLVGRKRRDLWSRLFYFVILQKTIERSTFAKISIQGRIV